MALPWMNSFALITTAVLGLIALASIATGAGFWATRGRSAAALWLIPSLGASFAIGGSWAGAFMVRRMSGPESASVFWAWAVGLVVIGLIGAVLGLGTAASIQLRAAERREASGKDA